MNQSGTVVKEMKKCYIAAILTKTCWPRIWNDVVRMMRIHAFRNAVSGFPAPRAEILLLFRAAGKAGFRAGSPLKAAFPTAIDTEKEESG